MARTRILTPSHNKIRAAGAGAWQGWPGARALSRTVNAWEAAGAVSDWSECITAIARDRDRAQFAALFAHFGPRLKSYFLRLGTAPGAADDLVQETLLAVWRKADRYDPGRAAASTWIFTIARNLRIDMHRRQRGPLLPENLDGGEPVPQPGDHLLSAERETRVRAALSVLPPDQAAVIRMAFFEERSHSQISEALGIPLGTVKSRVRLAMTRLRDAVGELS
jgi:RNA polymerase sigma-70 factor (ECF subfamily)